MLRFVLPAVAFLPIAFATPAVSAEKDLIVAGGCFWCIEKDFEQVAGVKRVVSGYTGGKHKNPTYKNHPGHREAVKITYDDTKVDYATLLHTFWRTVDPTDAGGQFCDRGHAYTTAVYVSSDSERKLAEKSKAEAQSDLGRKIVTPIVGASLFTNSEEYHQNYYKKNPVRYKYYRYRCGRDQKVKALWGKRAYPNVGKTS